MQEAQGSFAIVELGAGWAPWCAIAHRGARMRGIEKIRVVAVEGEAGHVGFIHEHLRDNGVPAEAARVLHGIAGPRDGVAEFPRHQRASSDYGGAAAFGAFYAAAHVAGVERRRAGGGVAWRRR